MKKIKIIVFTAISCVCLFVAVIYSSCSKDNCKNVSCQNGVTACLNGTCICPTGYTGNFCELSSVFFKNDSYTPVYITVSGASTTIPPDSTVAFTGQSGEALTMYAYTFGTNSSNNPVGDSIVWSGNYNFPVNGATKTVPLDVYVNYFYLEMIDSNSTQSIASIYVNYGITGAQTLDHITVPNDRKVHGIGYYISYPATEIYALSSSGYPWTITPPAIPDTILNEAITVTAN